MVLQRDGATVVIDDVPARVCENCGEDYVDEKVAESVLGSAEEAVRARVRVEIRDYVAARGGRRASRQPVNTRTSTAATPASVVLVSHLRSRRSDLISARSFP